LLGLATTGLALALSGHASAADPQWLTRPAVFLHAVAIAWWIGALIPLALLIRAGDPGYPAALLRFSRRVPYAVAVILVAGLTLAIFQIETPAAVLATAYGRLFAAKLALVLILLALAAWNRWRLTPALAAAAPGARRAMVRAIAVETLLVALIFGVVAGWRFTPPPRALAAASEAPVSLHLHDASVMAMLTLTPGRAGPVAVAVDLMGLDGRPLAAKGVTLVLSSPGAGIGPIRRAAVPAGPGQWRIASLLVPVAGTWQIDLEVLVDDFTEMSLKDAVTLR
jgi:copper transport protein